MIRSACFSALCLFTTVSAAALSAPAFAQTEGVPSAEPTVAEVVVTATRREQSLQEVPMAVDAISGAQLSKLKIFDFHDVSQLAPGLELTNNDGRSNVATLRGITYDPDSGAPPAVDLYVNEFPIDAQTALTAVYDVSQIEVLRGPQGLYRGRTSPAGSITLTTQRPSLSQVTGYLQATGSTLDAENFQGAVSVPLVQDKLAVRVAGLVDHNRSNSVRDVNVGDDRSRSKTESYRVSVDFAPTDNFDGVLMYQYLHSDMKPYIAVFGPGNQPSQLSPALSGPPISIDDREAVSEGSPRFQNRTNLLTLATNNHFDWATLSVNLGYQNTALSQMRDQDTTNAVPDYVQGQQNHISYKVFNLDVRLSSPSTQKFTWMLGATYNDNNDTTRVSQPNNQFVALATTPVPASLVNIPVTALVDVPTTSDSWSGFATVGYKFTDRLHVDVGLRYSSYHISQQSFLTVNASGATVLQNSPTIAPDASSRTYSPLTGGASLTFDINPDLTTYFAYGHSYRTGTAAVGVTDPLASDLLVSKPESSNSYEVGFKGQFWNRRISFNGDVFYQTFKNYISHVNVATSANADGVITSTGTPLNINGDAKVFGIEGNLAMHPLRDLDLSVNAAYADAHFTNARVPCNVFDAAGNPVVPVGQQVAYCIRNDRIAQVPKFSLTSTGEYRFPEVRNTTPFIRALITYRPAFTSTLDNFDYPAFTNFNLFLGVRGPESRWELTAWTKNLLNQARPLSVSDAVGTIGTLDLAGVTSGVNRPGVPFVSGYRTAVITAPREFGVTFQVNF